MRRPLHIPGIARRQHCLMQLGNGNVGIPKRCPHRLDDMKAIFIDCNDQLAPVWQKVRLPDDPQIDVNRKNFNRDGLPAIIGNYEIALNDHSYMPTELVTKCPNLKHIVFLGTGAASYMNVVELKSHGVTIHTIKGYGDTAVAEHTIALMFAAARNLARMDRDV